MAKSVIAAIRVDQIARHALIEGENQDVRFLR
jgi:hypothetical protein